MIRFSKLYRRHTRLVVKNNVGLKILGNKAFQSLYSIAVWFINSKESLEKKTSFHDQFKKIIKHYKGVEYRYHAAVYMPGYESWF